MLTVRGVHDWKWVRRVTKMPDIPDHTHNFPRPILLKVTDVTGENRGLHKLTDGIFLAEISPGHGFVDDPDPRRCFGIACRQITAPYERYFEAFEKPGIDFVITRMRLLPRDWRRLAKDTEPARLHVP